MMTSYAVSAQDHLNAVSAQEILKFSGAPLELAANAVLIESKTSRMERRKYTIFQCTWCYSTSQVPAGAHVPGNGDVDFVS